MLQQPYVPEALAQYSDKIYQLCMSNPQFAGLYTEFGKVSEELSRVSLSSNSTSDYLENLKKSQTYLQDKLEIFLVGT